MRQATLQRKGIVLNEDKNLLWVVRQLEDRLRLSPGETHRNASLLSGSFLPCHTYPTSHSACKILC